MTQGQSQAVLAASLGLIFAISIYLLARKGRLNFRYAVGWLTLCLVGLVAGVLVPVVGPLADLVKVTPAALVSIAAVILLLSICIQLSVSISGMQEQIRRLTEELAQLRMKVAQKDRELPNDRS
jgi:uncharacterized membrane protein YfcA